MRKEIFFTILRVDSFFSTPQTPMYRQVDKRTKRYFYSRSFIFYTIKRKYRIIQHIWISFFTYPYSSYIFFLFFLTTNSRLRSSNVLWRANKRSSRVRKHLNSWNFIANIYAAIQIFIHAVSWNFTLLSFFPCICSHDGSLHTWHRVKPERYFIYDCWNRFVCDRSSFFDKRSTRHQNLVVK